MNCNGGGAIEAHKSTRQADLAAYDALPRSIREAVASCAFNMASEIVLDNYRYGVGITDIRQAIADYEASEIELFSVTLWPATHGVYPHVGANATILRQTPPRRRA